MIRALLDLIARLVGRRPDSWADDVDLVPLDCPACGPIDYCDHVTTGTVPHDLSDYDDYLGAAMRKCRNCGMKTAFLVGDVYFVRHDYDAPRDPMCVACQALLSEPVTR